MEAIDTAYKSRGKSMHCVVMLGGSGGDGHAVNIQLDEARNKFRFMDDNLGDSEYTSYDEFKTQFQDLIKSFYKEFNQFSLRFYRLA